MKSEWKLCLFRYSPLHTLCQVKAQCREYPATLLLTGDHDDRVVPLHSLKFIAELQHVLGTAHQQVPNVVVLLSLLLLLCPPPYGRGALSDTTIHLSVCLSHGAAVQAIGMLAACSLATAGHQRCADCGPDGPTDVDLPRFLPPLNCHRRGGGILYFCPGGDTLFNWTFRLYFSSPAV